MAHNFEKAAHGYDTPSQHERAEVIVAEIRKCLKGIDLRTAMDFGCGTGLVGLPLAPLFKSLFLADPSEKMIEVTQTKIDSQGIANATALCVDLVASPDPDIKVDCIFMAQVLIHIPDTQLVFERMHQMLNEGGLLIIVDFDKTPAVQHPNIHNGFTHNELAELADRTSFTNTQIKTFYQGKNNFAKQDASMFILTCTK